MRVAVFAQGDAARAAEEAGADVVGADDLVAQVEGGFLDFDVAIATPDLMGQVGKLGRTLGPRGLMPNPKTGTVTPDVGKAVGEFKAGKVEYRTDRYGNVHVPLGKASFDAADAGRELPAVLDELLRAKPASAKGRYLRSVSLSSTMGPGVKARHLGRRRLTRGRRPRSRGPVGQGGVHRVDERAVARALPAGDHVVHHVAERDPGVGVGEAERAAGAEVPEAPGVGTERPARGGRLEPEPERDLLAEDRAVPRGLRRGGVGEQLGRQQAAGLEQRGVDPGDPRRRRVAARRADLRRAATRACSPRPTDE